MIHAYETGGRVTELVSLTLLNAIDIVNAAQMALSGKEDSFSSNEMKLLKTEFIERFIERLKKYSKGRRVLVKEFNNDLVGFRWS